MIFSVTWTNDLKQINLHYIQSTYDMKIKQLNKYKQLNIWIYKLNVT